MGRASMARTPTRHLRITPRISSSSSIINNNINNNNNNNINSSNSNNSNSSRASMVKALEEEMPTKIKTTRNRLANNSGTA